MSDKTPRNNRITPEDAQMLETRAFSVEVER